MATFWEKMTNAVAGDFRGGSRKVAETNEANQRKQFEAEANELFPKSRSSAENALNANHRKDYIAAKMAGMEYDPKTRKAFTPQAQYESMFDLGEENTSLTDLHVANRKATVDFAEEPVVESTAATIPPSTAASTTAIPEEELVAMRTQPTSPGPNGNGAAAEAPQNPGAQPAKPAPQPEGVQLSTEEQQRLAKLQAAKNFALSNKKDFYHEGINNGLQFLPDKVNGTYPKDAEAYMDAFKMKGDKNSKNFGDTKEERQKATAMIKKAAHTKMLDLMNEGELAEYAAENGHQYPGQREGMAYPGTMNETQEQHWREDVAGQLKQEFTDKLVEDYSKSIMKTEGSGMTYAKAGAAIAGGGRFIAKFQACRADGDSILKAGRKAAWSAVVWAVGGAVTGTILGKFADKGLEMFAGPETAQKWHAIMEGRNRAEKSFRNALENVENAVENEGHFTPAGNTTRERQQTQDHNTQESTNQANNGQPQQEEQPIVGSNTDRAAQILGLSGMGAALTSQCAADINSAMKSKREIDALAQDSHDLNDLAKQLLELGGSRETLALIDQAQAQIREKQALLEAKKAEAMERIQQRIEAAKNGAEQNPERQAKMKEGNLSDARLEELGEKYKVEDAVGEYKNLSAEPQREHEKKSEVNPYEALLNPQEMVENQQVVEKLELKQLSTLELQNLSSATSSLADAMANPDALNLSDTGDIESSIFATAHELLKEEKRALGK